MSNTYELNIREIKRGVLALSIKLENVDGCFDQSSLSQCIIISENLISISIDTRDGEEICY